MVWVIMRWWGVSSECRRSSCSSYGTAQNFCLCPPLPGLLFVEQFHLKLSGWNHYWTLPACFTPGHVTLNSPISWPLIGQVVSVNLQTNHYWIKLKFCEWTNKVWIMQAWLFFLVLFQWTTAVSCSLISPVVSVHLHLLLIIEREWISYLFVNWVFRSSVWDTFPQ